MCLFTVEHLLYCTGKNEHNDEKNHFVYQCLSHTPGNLEVLMGLNPAGISVLPGRQPFHLGSTLLPGRTENPAGFFPPRGQGLPPPLITT